LDGDQLNTLADRSPTDIRSASFLLSPPLTSPETPQA
jgi:hypothetical protein